MLKVNAATICGLAGRLLLVALCHGLWNVREHGARGDNRGNDTAAIQAAIDKCVGAGGGTIYVPAGDYHCGQLHLKTGVFLGVAGKDTAHIFIGSNDLGGAKEPIRVSEEVPEATMRD